MRLPDDGVGTEEIVAALAAKRTGDARWQDGRTFTAVYDGGRSVHEVAEAVAAMFLHDNALNTAAFPSLAEIQSEVVGMCAGLMHAPDGAAGFMTSGGTESILLAVKAARERGRATRGVTEPEMVLAESAHAAFDKACQYFGVRINKVRVGADFRADVDAMAAAVNEQTVLVVGSAPQYPQGVIDPIPELAALAATVGASMHVDACMGGFVLPFMELIGDDGAAVGLPRRRRHDDLGRHPQARLRAQGRVGDHPPDQGAAPVPDVRVRRLAGRPIRIPGMQGRDRACRWRRRGR